MSNTILSSDLEAVKRFLLKRGILSKSSMLKCEKTVSQIHRRVYSFAILEQSFRSKNPATHFLSEMKSDAFQILPICLMGYRKLAYLLLRGLIENSLSYIFYFHHEIEYMKLDLFAKQFMTITDLSNYVVRHPLLLEPLRQFDFITPLKAKYFQISRVVHAASIKNMQLLRGLSSIGYDHSLVEQVKDEMAEVTKLVIFMLCKFHWREFTLLQPRIRGLILLNLPADLKRRLFSIK